MSGDALLGSVPERLWALVLNAGGVEFGFENGESMISKDLLEILACPACRQPLSLKPDGMSLKCEACRRVYPIRDDIPILLIDEARIEEV